MVVSNEMWRDDLVGLEILEYRLTKLLRRGSVGDVYEATGSDNRKVAIKILSNTSESARGRFLREIKVIQALKDSPHLVGYLADGEIDGGMRFLVMEYVDGINLRDGLTYRGKLDPVPACQTMIQICEAFRSLHTNGLVHGDVRPDNLMLDRRNLVKIVDLGLVRDVQGLLKLTEQVDLGAEKVVAGVEGIQGSPQYLSPEQIRLSMGQPAKIDTNSDVYSLGLIFYQLLSGKVRFPFKSAEDTDPAALRLYFRQRLNSAADSVPAIAGVEDSLYNILESALRLDPATRPKDAMLLRYQIERYLANEDKSLDFDDEKTIAAEEGTTPEFIPEHGGGRMEDGGLFERFIGDWLDGAPKADAPQTGDDELNALIAEAEAAVSKPKPKPAPAAKPAPVSKPEPTTRPEGSVDEFEPEPTAVMKAQPKAAATPPAQTSERDAAPEVQAQPISESDAVTGSMRRHDSARSRTHTSMTARKSKKPIQWAFWIELVILMGLMGFMVYYLVFKW